jgi:hypothetical protein
MTAKQALKDTLATAAYTSQQKEAFVNFLYEVIPEALGGTIDDDGTITISFPGLGTAAFEDIGTSGVNVPLLSTANTFGAEQAIASAALRVLDADSTGTDARLRITTSAAANVSNEAGLEIGAMTDVQLRTAALVMAKFTDVTDATRSSSVTFTVLGSGAGVTPLVLSSNGAAVTGRVSISSTAGDVASPANGDIWYNSTSGKFRAREAGSSVDMIGGGSGSAMAYIALGF